MAVLEPNVCDSELLAQFAQRVDRLCVSRRDPEFFHVERDEISVGLKAIARRLRSAPTPERSTTVWRPPYAV